jgi:hypothetical protein
LEIQTHADPEKTKYRESLTPANRLLLDRYEPRDAAMLSGYMGKSNIFDKAIADFSSAYADQNEKDHTSFILAIKNGKIDAEYEE